MDEGPAWPPTGNREPARAKIINKQEAKKAGKKKIINEFIEIRTHAKQLHLAYALVMTKSSSF
jgi:hypothetical protein